MEWTRVATTVWADMGNPTKPASWETLGPPGEEVHPTALPAGPEQDGRNRPFEPHIVITDDQPTPAQAPGHQPAQGAGPAGTILGAPHGDMSPWGAHPRP